MKKYWALGVLLALLLTLVGCSGNNESAVTPETEPTPWGLALTAENVTPTGLTIVCTQSGEDTVSELFTGSYFAIHKLGKSGWESVEYAPQEYDVAWTAEAWMIPLGGTVSWEVNWQWLYGELPKGTYRIEKEITNFRGPGDFDLEPVYVYFEIE